MFLSGSNVTDIPSVQFQAFARYNRWANERLYEACSNLDGDEYLKERPTFFRSIHGVLNHGLLTDRSQMGWFTGKVYAFSSLDDEVIGDSSLDDEVIGDFPGLRQAREEEDRRIIRYVASLTPDNYGDEITFTNIYDVTLRGPLYLLLNHFFNHQTHHRGQAHDLLCQTDIPPPPLDFLLFVRQPESARVTEVDPLL